MHLDIGILTIGSLFWDSERDSWRKKRLDINSPEQVTAPIRYGRRSKKRGDSFTMVFSRSSPKGQARVFRCLKSVTSIGDLVAEAEQLWMAESNNQGVHSISSSWGCVALLQNPNREIPPDLLNDWALRVSRESGYGNILQTKEEGCLVSIKGLLNIQWPRLISDTATADLSIDLLLATATCPTFTCPTFQGSSPRYPSPKEIADAWKRDQYRNIFYFDKNKENGICTFQDPEISSYLER